MRSRRMLVLVLLVLLAALAAAGCGSNDNKDSGSRPAATTAKSTTTTIDEATAKAAITANFEKFFDGKVPADQKLDLLEDSAALKDSLIKGSTEGPNAQAAAASTTKVTNIELWTKAQCDQEGVTAPCALVTHDLLVNGQPALQGQKSYAVYVDGNWRVSKISYCGLQALGGNTPEPCK